MQCPEKVSLQRQVKDGWSAYEAVVKESGAPLSISEVIALRLHHANPGAYAEALRLRGEHLKVSRELSRHLSRHRC